MMGSGKTTTGRALARLAKMNFFDIDEAIEARAHQSINEIFKDKGEEFFRAEEKRLLAEASQKKNTVIATGGGIVLDPENIDKMKATGKVIYLVTLVETLWERVKQKVDRPLLQVRDPREMLTFLFQERCPFYEVAADLRVDTDGLAPEAVAEKILERHLK
jgi:shikimate kinase